MDKKDREKLGAFLEGFGGQTDSILIALCKDLLIAWPNDKAVCNMSPDDFDEVGAVITQIEKVLKEAAKEE